MPSAQRTLYKRLRSAPKQHSASVVEDGRRGSNGKKRVMTDELAKMKNVRRSRQTDPVLMQAHRSLQHRLSTMAA